MHTNIYCTYTLNGKPPIILIHGFAASSYTFQPIMARLAQCFSVIAIDLPGYGRSEKSTSFNYSYENYAKLIRVCMDYFGLERANLAGHSMGGQIAMYTAKMIPKRIENIILINSSAYWGRVPKWARVVSHLPFFHLVARHLVQKESVKSTLENVLYDHSLITEEMMEEYERPLREKKFYKALARFLRHREGDLSTEELIQIRTPTLLLWGKEDNVIPLHAGEKLHNDLPHAKFVNYKKAGHLLIDERPDEVAEQIEEWCLGADSTDNGKERE